MMDKKGISGILVSIIMIALVLVVVVIVWGVVNNLIQERISSSQSCFGNFGEVSLDNKFTCFDTTTDPDQVRFSINIGDVEIDELLVSIASNEETKSFTITNEDQTIPDLTYYSDASLPVKLPEKNSGITYVYEWLGSQPSTIKIAPIIDGNQCETSDTIGGIDDCGLLA